MTMFAMFHCFRVLLVGTWQCRIYLEYIHAGREGHLAVQNSMQNVLFGGPDKHMFLPNILQLFHPLLPKVLKQGPRP